MAVTTGVRSGVTVWKEGDKRKDNKRRRRVRERDKGGKNGKGQKGNSGFDH